MLVLSFVLYLISASVHTLSVTKESDLRSQIAEGKKELQILINDDSTDPICWSDNIFALMDQECGSLNYESRSSTAVKLAMCHLKQSGFQGIDIEQCSKDTKSCIQQLSSTEVAFSTYNHFFTSIDNICVYVQMREKDKQVKQSIHNLYTATLESTDYLMQTQQKQMEFQQDILDEQSQIKNANEELVEYHKRHQKDVDKIQTLNQEIQKQQSTILDNHDMFAGNFESLAERQQQTIDRQDYFVEQQKKSVEQQDQLYQLQDQFQQDMSKAHEEHAVGILNAKRDIEELALMSQNAHEQITSMIQDALYILNAIYKMDITLLQSFITITSVAVYSVWVLFSYVITKPASLRSARVTVFACMVLSVILEKAVESRVPERYFESDRFNDINSWALFIRKMMFALSIATTIHSGLTYRDPVQMQSQLLTEINSRTKRIPRVRISNKRITFTSALDSISPVNLYRRWKLGGKSI